MSTAPSGTGSARPRIDLRQLHYFCAVVDEGSISRAAARLHMSQPPLTVQIHNLEAELGIQLLQRHKKGVVPTAAGAALVEEARGILRHTLHSVERVRQVGRGEVGALRIGIIGSAMWGEFIGILKRLQANYPQVDWSLHELNPNAQVEALRERRIDVGFWRTPLSSKEFTCTRVATESVAAALPERHPLLARRSLPLAALADEALVMMNPAVSEFAAALMASCRSAGFEPRVAHTANEPATLLALVCGGSGITLLPESLQQISWPGVTFRPIASPRLSADLYMFARAGETSAVVANFAALAKTRARSADAPTRGSKAAR